MRLTLRLTTKFFFFWILIQIYDIISILLLFYFTFNTINKKPLFKYVEYLKGN